MIKKSIFLYNEFTLSSFKISPFVIVSGKPPLSLIITAQPADEASKLVLPKGSSHLEQTTAILVLLYITYLERKLKNMPYRVQIAIYMFIMLHAPCQLPICLHA